MFQVVDLENSASMSAGIPNRLYSSLCHPNTFLSPLLWSLLPTQHRCNMPKSRHVTMKNQSEKEQSYMAELKSLDSALLRK